MGVLQKWSSIIEGVSEIDMFEAVMSFADYLENEEEEEEKGISFFKGGYEEAFEKQYEEKAKCFGRLYEKTGLYFSSDALSKSYETLSEAMAPFIALKDEEYSQKEECYTIADILLSPKKEIWAEDEEPADASNTKEFDLYSPNNALSFDLYSPNNALSEPSYGSMTEKEAYYNSFDGLLEEALKKRDIETILKGAVKERESSKKHEIKVEMINRENQSEEFDVDEMLEKMTERLCSMMAKGADGIYL